MQNHRKGLLKFTNNVLDLQLNSYSLKDEPNMLTFDQTKIKTKS